MTIAARKLLADCDLALGMLEKETNLQLWRVHWAGAVALLRAVGHVLKKVDGNNPGFSRLIDQRYAHWKSHRTEHAIFWNFIEEERNNILKEYRFNLHPGEDVDIAVVTTLRNPETGGTMQAAEVFQLDENIYRPIIDGFREGDDARDVYREALDWWDAELSFIERNQ